MKWNIILNRVQQYVVSKATLHYVIIILNVDKTSPQCWSTNLNSIHFNMIKKKNKIKKKILNDNKAKEWNKLKKNK